MRIGDAMIDNLYGIYLDAIERHAGWVRSSGLQCADYAMRLSTKYEWRTRAEAAMEAAEVALREALKDIQIARRHYSSLKEKDAA